MELYHYSTKRPLLELHTFRQTAVYQQHPALAALITSVSNPKTPLLYDKHKHPDPPEGGSGCVICLSGKLDQSEAITEPMSSAVAWSLSSL